MDPYDLVVIGGGTAGLVASVGAAGLGARVALVERRALGGECLHDGCVPTKALLAAARAAHAVRRAPRFGVRVPAGVTVDAAAVWRYVREAIRQAGERDRPERLASLGVEVVDGSAAFVAPQRVAVGGRELVGRSVLIATGSHSTVPDVPGLAGSGYWTHVEAIQAEGIPGSLCVVGGGPIGVEFAQAFARLGSRVTLLEYAPHLLPREDPELSELVRAALEADGVEVLTGTGITAAGAGWVEAGSRRCMAERILVATGRAATLDGLGLAAAGIETDRNGVRVDRSLRTTARGVFAAGDCQGVLRFTHVAAHQGCAVVANALFGLHRGTRAAIPWVTYTDPEVGHLGLTEAEARARLGDGVRVYHHAAANLDRAICDGEAVGLVKLVADARGHLVGVHALGPRAGELVSEAAVAMRGGVRIGELAQIVHAYPTYAEALANAAGDYWRERLFNGGALGHLGRWLIRRRHR